MDFVVEGKVVLITGGIGVIGLALGRDLLMRGAKVSLCDINEKSGYELVDNLQREFGENNVIFSKCDVTKEEEFEAAYNECETELGTIDVLCNSAGALNNDFRSSMLINYGGAVIGTELAMKRMGKHHGGRGGIVVNISSVAGAAVLPFVPFYAASKAAVIHYSRCVGNEFHYEYSGVSVLCFCPKGVESEMVLKPSLSRGSYNAQSDKPFKEVMNAIPLLKVKEVAAGFVQLINENKTGEAMVLVKDEAPFYLPPTLVKEF